MKIERLGQDKIRIFLTFDDLLERGIQKDDMWRELPKVHELFSDMMDQAYNELGFDANGPLAVEVFALPAQGMVVIVTRGKPDVAGDAAAETEDDEEVYEMEVTLDQSDIIHFVFRTFEDVIAVAHRLQIASLTAGGSLYAYQERYFLAFEPALEDQTKVAPLIAMLAEYGEASSVTLAMLEVYGKRIIENRAVEELCLHFKA